LPPIIPEFREIKEVSSTEAKHAQAKVLRIVDPLHTLEKGLTKLQSEIDSDQSATLSSLKVPSEELLSQLPWTPR
jgi:hypothetical protein